MYTLTTGSIERIMSGELIDKPCLQVLGQKKIAGTQGPDRYRLLLSDGKFSHSSAMLATQLNDKITSGELDTNCVIQLDKYICNPIQPDRRVMIILEVTIVGSGNEVKNRIGEPQPLRNTGNNTGNNNRNTNQSTGEDRMSDSSVGSNGSNSAINTSAKNTSVLMAAAPSLSSTPSMSNNSRVYNGGTPMGFVDTPTNIHPIASLTPYQNRWTIRGRITQKSSIRTWTNSRGEGKLFNITITDESGEIRAVLFNAECDKFYNTIELYKVYYIRKGTLKTADKRYSTVANDYEMTFSADTEMSLCNEDETNLPEIPKISLNFIPINQLENHPPDSSVDVVGVVKSYDDLRLLTSKQGRELKKRDVTLVDESLVQIRLTMWAQDAETFDGSGNPVLAVKGCRLSDWGGRTLSLVSSSQLMLNPDIPEAHRLRGWYDDVGTSVSYSEYKREGDASGSGSSSTNWKTFGDVKAQNLGNDKPEYFTAKGTIVFLKKDNCMYMACPQSDCNKKVIDNGNGQYRCEKCQREYPNFKWRMILSANVADFSDNYWVTCFQDSAEQILGRKADELGQLRDENVTEFDHLFSEATFKSFIFRLRAKMETFNDENRMKTVCMQATPINGKDFNRKLITDIETLLGPLSDDVTA